MPPTPARAVAPATSVSPSCDDVGCDGFAGLTASRRGVLRGMAAGGLTAMAGSAVVTWSGGAASAAAGTGTDAVLVVLSLRGAADGLSLVVPHGDPAYYAARPRIAVPSGSLLAKDGFFGLHPAMRPLLPMWKAGELAAVHATGLPVANRSHFAAMEEIEDADPGSTTRSGWLNRLLGEGIEPSPLQGVAVASGAAPTSMFGTAPTMSFPSLESATIAGDNPNDARRTRIRSLEQVWAGRQNRMGQAVRSAMQAVDGLGPALGAADNSATYPGTDLGRALAMVARTIRGDVGTQVVTVDAGSWDMHNNIGTPAQGRLVNEASNLADSMAAFFADLGTRRSSVTVVTLSEFGRRVAENSANGLDHGWGNVMLVAGAGVRGGRYLGTWPGLQDTLDADLAVTTDYRSVLAEVVARRFPSASTARVFPGFAPEKVGVMSL